MKVFLVILTAFITLGSSSAYAQDDQAAKREKAEGIFNAIADFLASVFGDGDEEEADAGGNNGNGNGNGNNGNAYGFGKDKDDGSSVPAIQDNDSSADFIASQIAAETGWAKEKMIPYSARLAKTLSQLSAKEQAEVFYGYDS